MEGHVLVLNQNFEPLNVCTLKRAIRLMIRNKVEIVEAIDGRSISSINATFPYPSVIRLKYYVGRPKFNIALTKKTVLMRDNHTCQYCGRKEGEMTIDHVIPRDRGGKTVWENVVCACKSCNIKKGNRLPEEAGMKLLSRPRKPRLLPFLGMSKTQIALQRKEWRKYLFLDDSWKEGDKYIERG
jgi:5-methylcytosine-specific restriction endonuclease McrA